MNNHNNKSLDSPQTGATITFNQKIYRLEKGYHLLGRKCKHFAINDESVDEKHALICITTSEHQIVDLESQNGVYINNEKINLHYKITNKISSIRLGNFNFKYSIISQSDSGFLDSKINFSEKDTSDIVPSSPEHIRNGNGTRIQNIKNRRRNITNSSTPNFRHISKDSYTSEESETDYTKSKKNKSDATISDHSANESFFVPETQQLEQSKSTKIKPVNIFDTIVDKNIKQLIIDISKDDDYYVPETQEIFQDSKHFNSSDNIVFVNTLDFHDTIGAKSDTNNSNSENLCPYFEFSKKNISTEKNQENYRVNSNKCNRTTNETDDEMSQLQWNETEHEPRSNATTPDIDFGNIKENIKQDKIVNNILDEREESVTPDLIFENQNTVEDLPPQKSLVDNFQKSNSSNTSQTKMKDYGNNEHLDNILLERAKFVATNLLFENKNVNNLSFGNSSNEELKKSITNTSQTKMQNLSNNSNKEELCNDFMDDDNLLVPTQPFILPVTLPSRASSIKIENCDLLEETQIFIHAESKNKSDDKNDELLSPFVKPMDIKKIPGRISNCNENNINNDENDEEIACTQTFIVPIANNYRSISKNLNINNLDSSSRKVMCNTENRLLNKDKLETPKRCMLNEMGKDKSKIQLSNIFEKNKEKRKEKESNANRKRSSEVLLKNGEDTTKENKTKKKTLCNEITSITNFNSSANDYVTPTKQVSDLSNTCVDIDFMLDICTPSNELIKLPYKEQGYMNVVNKFKKPINRIFVEETDDEDYEMDELQNMLSENVKNNPKTKVKKAEKIKSNLNFSKKEPKLIFERQDRKSTSSEETPKFDFLPPVVAVEDIKKLGLKTNLRSKHKKFLMEETQTTIGSSNMELLETEKDFDKKKNNKNIKLKEKQKTEKNKKSGSLTTSNETNIGSKNVERKTKAKRSLTNSNSDKSLDSDLNFETNLLSKPVRHTRKNKMTLAFTKVNEAEYVKTVQNMGYTTVNDPEDATIMVTNNEISRTWKFLIALAKGIPIISVEWLKRIEENNFSYVPYDQFYVKDKRAEKKFNFSLRETLHIAANASEKIFNRYYFIVTENTVPPKSEMEKIIKCGGGTLVEDSTKKSSESNFYVVSDKRDSKLWPAFKKNIKNLAIIKTEGVLLSIMQQKTRLDDHIFN